MAPPVVLDRTIPPGFLVQGAQRRPRGAVQDEASGDDVTVTKRERIDHDALHRRAQVGVLSGLAAGDDVYHQMTAAAPSHVPGRFTPDVALLELAVMALDLACPAGVEPLELRGCGSATCRR